jgi:hypothetical protein
MNEKDPCGINPAFLRRHFGALTTTGGQQPYGQVTPLFQHEQIWDCTTGFLDAPAFLPTGGTEKVGPFEEGRGPAVVQAILVADGRLA